MAKYRSIVVLTGAGISAESGIPTFRGSDGLWEGHRVEDVATPEAFARDPELVLQFYNMRRAALKTVEPNPAHQALAKLEDAFDGDLLIVTQNVDDLHERAGSKNVLHMHGELKKAWCLGCDGRALWEDDILETSRCPHCAREGRLRPDIVWFGEMPYQMERIDAALSACDLFVSIGTSGNVYPAAGFVALVRHYGRAHTLELNLDPSEGSRLFAETRHGPASKLVPAFVDEVLGG
ncbi:NAD-dependent deacylase [Pedomonas mirosovicensis]|uniref:NAD-dependent deacylase n=1 Tax=Pedomonas mirosovicensis TaxID=2908641 RepID=UPI00216A3C9B|nr:NAD-dependent deacylase [Pedomonas mirosovicensis]MCH8683895.1 NAD-dependent deacylase [Pedomonas mirosovicensis]